jgi:membrane protease YdiL (CAAX protease family)
MKSFFALSSLAQYFLFLVLIFVPVAGVASYLRIRSGKPLRPKRQRYYSIIVVQGVILVVTLGAAWREGIELLGRTGGDPLIWLGAIAYLAFIALRVPRAWAKKKNPARLEQARRFLPDDVSLMRLWVVISALAGISEECAFRGLAYRLLVGMGLNIVLAVLVCVVAFAVGHLTQGWRAVLGTFVLALLFHGLVFATHSLYLAIVFHAAFNLIVGTTAVRYFRQLPKPVEAPQPVEV